MPASTRPLILASSSVYRRELLERLQLSFEVASPDADESLLPDETPEAAAVRLSTAKALALTSRHPTGIIIGSDQIGVCGNQILSKPGNIETAKQQLRMQSGQQSQFHTGVCVTDARSGECLAACVTTTIRFRPLSDADIDNYLASDSPLDCAGSFKSESLGITLFESVASEDPTALVGLPLIATARFLREFGLII
ncbi:MAG: Maf family protein [bacterium]